MSDAPTAPDLEAPADLEAAGEKLWRQIAQSGKYTLRPDELRVLEDACREADLIDDLTVAARGANKIVRGSMGQDVINPLISELRQHRSTLKSLLAALSLPDAPVEVQPRSVSARKAAASRWDKSA